MRGQIAVKNYSVDKDGFITVRGHRVKGSGNMPVKFRKTGVVYCQLCKQQNVVCNLGIFMRWESAFNIRFYWTRIVGPVPRYCNNCADIVNS